MNLHGHPFQPDIHPEANCGPTVLAALLGIDTKEACQLMDKTYKKGHRGYTNVGHIKAALQSKNIDMIKTKDFDGQRWIEYSEQTPLLLFLQLDGEWVKKGWRSAYNHTHWALFQNDHAMDVNNIFTLKHNMRTKVPWVTRTKWHILIMPFLMESENCDGWYVRSGYYVKQGEEL